jgi:hypothetical protein
MRNAFDEDSAGATLAFAAAVLSASKVELVTKHPKKRALRICFDAPPVTVD